MKNRENPLSISLLLGIAHVTNKSLLELLIFFEMLELLTARIAQFFWGRCGPCDAAHVTTIRKAMGSASSMETTTRE